MVSPSGCAEPPDDDVEEPFFVVVFFGVNADGPSPSTDGVLLHAAVAPSVAAITKTMAAVGPHARKTIA